MGLFEQFNNLFKTWKKNLYSCSDFENGYYQFEYDKLSYTCKIKTTKMYIKDKKYDLSIIKFKTENIIAEIEFEDSEVDKWINFEKKEYKTQCKNILRFGKEILGKNFKHYAFRNDDKFIFKFVNDTTLEMIYIIFSSGYPEELIES